MIPQKESAKLFKATLDVFKASAVIIDSNGEILAVNESWKGFVRLFGGDIGEESEGQNIFAINDSILRDQPDTASALAENIKAVLEGQGDRPDYTFSCTTSTGKLWFSSRATIISLQPFTAVAFVVEDITKEVIAQEDKINSEQYLQNLIDLSPNCVFVTDKKQRYLFVNKAFADLYGLEKNEMLYKNDSELGGNALIKFDQTSSSGAGVHLPIKDGYYYEKKDGSKLLFSTVKKSLQTPRFGKCYLNVALDVTEQYEAHENLRNSELLLRTMLDAQTNRVVLLDRNRRILWLNSMACEEAGMSRLEIIGKPCHEVWGDNVFECDVCPVMQAIKSGEPHYKKETTKDGNILRVSGFPVRDNFGQIVSAVEVAENITETVSLERQLRQAQKMESLGTLAGGVAHDFNNILSGILGYTELAMEETLNPEIVTEYLAEVYRGGIRATELTRQILTFSRQSEVSLGPVSVEPVVKEALNLLRSTLPTSIEFKTDIESKLKLIMADPIQLHQIVMNLCTNASHAMEPKGGILGIEIKNIDAQLPVKYVQGVLQPGQYVKLSISDTGCGMSNEVVSLIFDPYFTTKDLGEGTGLGLAVVHGIVKEYGGEIFVRSLVDIGTTFDLFFPIVHEEQTQDSASENRVDRGGDERILVVDDEAVICKIAKKILEKQGFKVTAMQDSSEALEHFKQDPFAYDLVLSDVNMPKMNGDQLALKMLEVREGLPIILCTGFSRAINEKDIKNKGVRSILIKPLSKKAMLTEIRKVLDHQNTPRRRKTDH